MDNKKITLKQTVTDKDGNQEVKTISTYTDEAILASETNINEKISDLETNIETNASKISNLETNVETNASKISNLEANVENNTSKISNLEMNVENNTSKISNLEMNVENNTSKISANTAEIENLKAQGSTVSLLPLKQIIKNGTYSAVDDNVDGYAKVAVNIPSYPFVVTDVGTYYPKDGYLFDSVTLPDIPIKNAFQTIGYDDVPDGFNSLIEYAKELASKWNPSNTSVSIFKNDEKLVYAPYIDTSNVTDMAYMFHSCSSLTAVPQMDTSKVTDMSSMFEGCGSLTAVPQMDTSNVTKMGYMLRSCSSLTAVPQMDTSKVTNMRYMFYSSTKLASILMTGTKCSFDISDTILKHDALVTLLNNLGTANSGATLTMGSSKLALLSNKEKKIATDKGWILA